jgi:hypothetical protein
MRWLICAALVLTGCDMLSLDPQVEPPEDCGVTRRGYVGYPDSVLVDATLTCKEIYPGVWTWWYEYEEVQ